jgi:hypothetical protein
MNRLWRFVQVAFVCVAAALLGPAGAQAQFQRMRLAAGTYRLNGKSVVIPARCIDPPRRGPRSTDQFRAASVSIQVTRSAGGKRETKPLSEVLGKWGRFTGNGPSSVRWEALDDAKYEVTVAPGYGGVLGPTSADVNTAVKTITDRAIQAHIRKLDDFGGELRKVFGEDSNVVAAFHSEKWQVEGTWLDDKKGPEQAVEQFLASFRQGLTANAPARALGLLSILRRGPLTERQIKAAEKLLGTKLGDYPDDLREALKTFADAQKALEGDNALRPLLPRFQRRVELLYRAGKDLAAATADANDWARGVGPFNEQLDKDRTLLAATLGANSPAVRAIAPLQNRALFSAYDIGRPTAGALKAIRAEVFGTGPEDALQVLTLRHGRKLDATQVETLTKAGVVRGEYKREFLADLTRYSAICEGLRKARSFYVFTYEGAVLRNYLRSRDLRWAMADAGPSLLPPHVAAVRDPGAHLALVRERKLRADEAEALSAAAGVDLTKASGLEDHLVLVPVGEYVLLRTTESSSVTRLRDLTPAKLKELDGKYRKIIVREGQATALEEKLAAADVGFVRYQDFLREARQAAFTKKRSGDGAAGPRRTTYRFYAADENNRMSVSYLNLKGDGPSKGLGDSILLRCPDASLVLIDTGLSKDGYEQVLKHLPGGKPKLDVVITHEDADHLAGLKRLLADGVAKGKVEINQVILGTLDGKSKLLEGVRQLLTDLGYGTVPVVGVGRIEQYLAKGLAASGRYQVRAEQLGGSPFTAFELQRPGGCRMQVLQYRGAQSSNENAFIVKVSHKGKTQLLTSDIDLKVIEELLRLPAVSGGAFSLQSDVLKWPHHISFPKDPTPAFKATMRRFLQLADPHTVVFSNQGIKQDPKRQEAARKFIEEALGHEVRVLWTYEGEGTTLEFITRVFRRGGHPRTTVGAGRPAVPPRRAAA